MAIIHVGKWTIHFVAHPTTKTTALNLHAIASFFA